MIERVDFVMDAIRLDADTELAYFVGGFRTTPTRDGVQIFQYRPDPNVPAAPPMEKKEN